MIALKSHCLMTLAILFAIATGCSLSAPNVPLKGIQKPPVTFATEQGSQRTYSAPGGSYLAPTVRKVQPIYANNLKSSSLNAAKNFNSPPFKDELVNNNINNTPLNKNNPAFVGNNDGVPRESSVISPSSNTGAAQTQPAQQLAPSVDGLLKQISASGPVQSGTSNVNINNNVSTVKVGNSKNKNINIGLPALQGGSSLGDPDEARRRAMDDIASRYIDGGQAYDSSFGPRQRPLVYDNQVSPSYLFDEEDYFANNNGGYNNGQADYGEANKQDPERRKKCDKKKKKPTNEQIELKNQLLDLAAKATSAPVPDDSPLLKYNKETGALEQVQADPDAQLYKNKLQEALSVLNPKKLSAKKLKKVLYGLSDDNQVDQGPEQVDFKSSYGDQPSNGYYNVPGMGLLRQPNNNRPGKYSPELSNYGNDEDLRQSYYSQLPESQYAQSSRPPSYSRGADYSVPSNQQIDLSALDDEQKRSLVDQVRAVLNDNINRFNEVVAFSDEFLEQLLYVSDDELTPKESLFKHMILCNADERYCQRNNEVNPGLPQHYGESLPETGEFYQPNTGYDNGQEEAQEWSQQPNNEQANNDYDANGYYEQPEEVMGQAEVGQNRYMGAPIDQQLEDELITRRESNQGFSRHQSASDSYLYRHSAGGARNGVPLAPQSHEYAEQSSYLRTNQGPPTVSSRANLVVGSNDGRFMGSQVQQPAGRGSTFASQSAALNGSNNNNKGNQVREERPLPSVNYSTRQPGEQVTQAKRSIGFDKPQTVPSNYKQQLQQGGQQMKQQFNQQAARVLNGLSNTVASSRANLNVNSGGRISKLQHQQ